MKQNLIYLAKGLLFSAAVLTIATLLLAFLMMKTGWNDAVMFPLLIVVFCLAVFIGGRYFAGHAKARRFLWGIGFGAAFFVFYAVVTYFLSDSGTLISDHSIAFLLASFGSGCVGGMLS